MHATNHLPLPTPSRAVRCAPGDRQEVGGESPGLQPQTVKTRAPPRPAVVEGGARQENWPNFVGCLSFRGHAARP